MLAEKVFHLGLVAAEERRLNGLPRNLRRRSNPRDGKNVSLDGGLDAVNPRSARLNGAHGVHHRRFITDRRDLLICIEPSTEASIEILHGPLADACDKRPGLSEGSGKISLIGGELWSNQDDVHENLRVRRRRISRYL